jgi:hypothetical protein
MRVKDPDFRWIFKDRSRRMAEPHGQNRRNAAITAEDWVFAAAPLYLLTLAPAKDAPLRERSASC